MDNKQLNTYLSTWELTTWAKVNLNIIKANSSLTNAEIRRVIRWIGACSVDTIYTDGEPVLGRVGISNMLTVTLLEFPEYYMKYELAQFN